MKSIFYKNIRNGMKSVYKTGKVTPQISSMLSPAAKRLMETHKQKSRNNIFKK